MPLRIAPLQPFFNKAIFHANTISHGQIPTHYANICKTDNYNQSSFLPTEQDGQFKKD